MSEFWNSSILSFVFFVISRDPNWSGMWIPSLLFGISAVLYLLAAGMSVVE